MSESQAPYITESRQEVQFIGHLLREGFAQVPHAIIRSPRLSANAKLVVYLLLSRAAKDGTSFEGHEGMAARLRLSVSSVRRALDELKAVGLLDWQRPGQGKTNIYLVLQDGLEQFVADCSVRTIKSVQPGQSRLSPGNNKEYPEEEQPVEEELDNTHTQEQKKPIWPDWYATLYAIPGFKIPLKHAVAWVEKKGVLEARAEETAYAVKSKWPGPTRSSYKDPWATFQHWVVRPPLNSQNGNNLTGGRNGITRQRFAPNHTEEPSPFAKYG